MGAGRPSKYREEYCDAIIKYFDVTPFSTDTDDMGRTVINACLLPTLNKFAHSIGVNKDTLLEWARVHPEFSVALKTSKELQEDILMHNGLMGGYDKTFAIFTAKNVCNWRDAKQVDNTSSDGSMTPGPAVVVDADAVRMALEKIKKDI